MSIAVAALSRRRGAGACAAGGSVLGLLHNLVSGGVRATVQLREANLETRSEQLSGGYDGLETGVGAGSRPTPKVIPMC